MVQVALGTVSAISMIQVLKIRPAVSDDYLGRLGMLLSDIMWGLLQVHWQKEGQSIYRLYRCWQDGFSWAILVPRSLGALAVMRRMIPE